VIAEVLKGYDISAWNGLFAPAGTPREAMVKVADAALSALAQRDVQDKLTGIGFEISPECSVKTFLEKGKVGEAYGKQTCRTIGVSKFKFRKVWKGYVEVLLRGMLHRFGILRYY
jgi:hypothetical protein